MESDHGAEVLDRLLGDERRFLYSLMRLLPGMIYRCRNDRDWTVELVSDVAEGLTGHFPQDLLDNRRVSFAQLIHPDDREWVWDGVQAAVAAGQPFDFEYRLVRPDGTERWVWERGQAVYDDGEVQALEGYICDVSDRRRLEASLAQAQRQASVGLLAGGVAHDFNNLLMVIQSATAMGIEAEGPEGPGTPLFEEVQQAAERGTGLARQLLDLTRAPRFERFELNELVRRLERLLRRVVVEPVELRLELSEGSLSVDGDPGQIDQILVNLVLNARDAMSEGGPLVVRTGGVDLDESAAGELGLGDGEGYVRLSVEDAGHGMDAETVRRSWEQLFTTKGGAGSGMGLPMARWIAERHGGAMAIDSAPRRGTRVDVLLPLGGEAGSESEHEPEDAAASSSRARQLVTDAHSS